MKYQEVTEILSQCGMGVLLLSEDSTILAVNTIGDRLLHGEGRLAGSRLKEIAPQLLEAPEEKCYANIVFGEYLVRCTAPEAELPEHTQMIVFRNATNDACHDMLLNAFDQVGEALILFDEKGRIWRLNDAAVRMDSMVTQDVIGEDVSAVYQMLDGSELTVPRVLQNKKPLLNQRQHYTTRYGRCVDIVSNTFPVLKKGQVLGCFNVMKDWSTVDHLHKQIIELQEKLTNRTSQSKAKSALSAKYHFKDIIHVSSSMNSVLAQCRQVAKSDSSVMLYGETGTGKELFAQSIHNASRRADGPFLAINCAAIPENLLESMLFGTEKGAYTGAERRSGLFEQADGGTLLLDEINSMNINLQSKLLRVLQEGCVRRVGGSAEISVDVRVLSNINIPPYQAVKEEKLRQDLFYRLGVVNINIPPLRERREDIPLLTKSFIMRYNKKLSRNVRNIDEATLALFSAYQWPGNVRELQHAVEHAMNILPDDAVMITPEYIPVHISNMDAGTVSPVRAGGSLNSTIKGIERSTICRVLRECGGNISESARVLEMSRQNLQYRIKRYQIDVAALIREK